ncbi:MAG: leucine-rich repeat domain-containing protein, partial [Muribaculaceae bacterium]|nr:leucine-rich repeat domain-containing protein [Muribaculaceae bacterium]
GCSSLTSVTIPDSVTSIRNSAFYGCSSLTSVTIGNSVTSIGEYTFSGCSSLTSVTIGNSVTSIGWAAFEDCSSLTSVTIPDSVTSIGSYTFQGCSSLTSVKLSENLEQIHYCTFYGCPKLESIEIPGSVKEIVQYYSRAREYFYTFTNLKRLSLKFSEEYLSSSYYSYNYSRIVTSNWDSELTDNLEEVFFDRQMVYGMPLPNVKTLSFGEHLNEVQVKNIHNCEKLETIVCYGTEPPTLPECSNKQYMNVVVKVPQEALEKYQQAEGWKNFWNLQGFDPSQSSVDKIPASSMEKVETGRFNLNGQRVGDDYQGVVIVRYSDGSTRKLIAK